MGLKKREFRNLRQGNRSVAEYIDVFNNLAHYAPDDVNTDASRRERFLDGMSDELALQLSVVHAPDYQTLLDKARILENKQQQIEGRKRKFNHGGTHSGSHKKTCNYYEGNVMRTSLKHSHLHLLLMILLLFLKISPMMRLGLDQLLKPVLSCYNSR
jgi:hypothetical protein